MTSRDKIRGAVGVVLVALALTFGNLLVEMLFRAFGI